MYYAAWILSVVFSLFAGKHRAYWSVTPVMLVSTLLVILVRDNKDNPSAG